MDHAAAEGGEVAGAAERAEDPELVHAVDDVVLPRTRSESDPVSVPSSSVSFITHRAGTCC